MARIQFAILFISWASPMIGGIVTISKSVSPDNSTDSNLIVPLHNVIPNGLGYVLFSMLIVFCNLASDTSLTFVVGFIATVDLQTGRQFGELASWLSQRLKERIGFVRINIEKVQETFFYLTKVLHLLNRVVGSQLGVIIIYSFYGVLVNLYRIEWSPIDERLGILPQFIFCICLLFASLIPSIVVNNVSGRTLEQLQLFPIPKLAGPNEYYKSSLLMVSFKRKLFA